MTENSIKNYRFPSGNYIQVLESKEEVLENWEFIKEGFVSLNDPRRANMNISLEDFLKNILRQVKAWPNGVALLLRSKNGKPLGFAAAYNCSAEHETQKVLWIYLCYSNGKCKTTVLEYMEWLFAFGKKYGYTKTQAASGRINGAAFYWYEEKLKFRRKYIVFEKDLTV